MLEKEACPIGAMARFSQVRITFEQLRRLKKASIERATEKTASEACSGRTGKRR